jgi:peptidoglycan/LPS O-acetylase OafA/YrhL
VNGEINVLTSFVSSERLPGLNLLRAAAILLVALHHTSSEAIPNSLLPIQEFGWMGVDLFFVLSGFLIGSQLLKQYALGRKPSISGFYARRAFRILPAFLTILGLYFLVPQFREQAEIAPLWKFLTFTMNLGFDRSKGAAFSHAWSLCVEEYFYLLFPIVCSAFMRWPSFVLAAGAAFFVAATEFLIRLWSWMFYVGPIIAAHGADKAMWIAYTQYNYYPTHTRLDGLLIGVVLAAIKVFRPVWWERAMEHGHSLGLGGSALTACAVWLFSDRASLVATVDGFPVLSIGLGLLLASSVSTNGLLARVRVPGTNIVATLSYSLYLTHKGVMHVDQSIFGGWLPMDGVNALPVYIGTSFAAAWFLHTCIEQPFLKLRDHLPPVEWTWPWQKGRPRRNSAEASRTSL